MLYRILSDPFAILLVVLFFGASIFVHELGHYLAARWRKLKIERFSIGFGPRLFGWKDKQGVDWRVSLLPLGGYVALPQLADMRGIEGEYHENEPLPELSYADKIIVAGAGAFFNVLFALALGCVLWVTGIPVSEEYESTTIGYVAETIANQEGVEQDSPAILAGLKAGDRILRIDGRKTNNWEDILYALTTGVRRSDGGAPRTDFTVERDGQELEIPVYPLLDQFEGNRKIGIAPANSLHIGAVMENSPAMLAGIQAGDEIIQVNGNHIYNRSVLSRIVQDDPEAELQLLINRSGSSISISLTPEQVAYNTAGDTVPMIGVQWQPIFDTQHVNPVEQVYDAVDKTLSVLGALVHPKSDVAISNLSGPVGIGYTLYVISQIGILEVLSIVVLINVNLAILNLLPIPVLDGGHMAFATVAKLRGRPIPARIIASMQGTFMLIFLAILVYVTFFDFGRVRRNESAISDAEQVQETRIPIKFKGQDQTTPAPDPAP